MTSDDINTVQIVGFINTVLRTFSHDVTLYNGTIVLAPWIQEGCPWRVSLWVGENTSRMLSLLQTCQSIRMSEFPVPFRIGKVHSALCFHILFLSPIKRAIFLHQEEEMKLHNIPLNGFPFSSRNSLEISARIPHSRRCMEWMDINFYTVSINRNIW